MKKIILAFWVLFLLIVSSPSSWAGNCGGETPCVSGDTITATWTMDRNVPMTDDHYKGTNLFLEPNQTLNGGGVYVISAYGDHIGVSPWPGTGVSAVGGSNIYGVSIKGFANGVQSTIPSTPPLVIDNSKFYYNYKGIISPGPSPHVTNSVFSHNSSGIFANTSAIYAENNLFEYCYNPVAAYAGANLVNNTIAFSFLGLFGSGGDLDLSGNQVIGCRGTIISSATGTRVNNIFVNTLYDDPLIGVTDFYGRSNPVGSTFKILYSMKDIFKNACPACDYTVSLYPPEESLSVQRTGANVLVSFTSTKTAVYTVQLKVTDPYGNISYKPVAFISGATVVMTDQQYLRMGKATQHGQRWVVMDETGDDAYPTSKAPPSDDEVMQCASWIQSWVDSVPAYPMSVLTGVAYYFRHRERLTVGENATLTVQPEGNYNLFKGSVTADIPSSYLFALAQGSLSGLTKVMNQPTEWYYVTMKLIDDGRYPFMKSTAADPSYITLTYDRSAAKKAIRAISNNYVTIRGFDDDSVWLENNTLDVQSVSLDIPGYSYASANGRTIDLGGFTINPGELLVLTGFGASGAVVRDGTFSSGKLY